MSAGEPSGTIYLDHNATTPVAPEVVDAVLHALRHAWANPSSGHGPGREARSAVEAAREKVADLVGVSPPEVLFTSGGTEADNLAVLGVARARRDVGRRVVMSAVEHAAVSGTSGLLEREGFEVVRVGVGPDGRVDAEAFRAALTADTAVASLMLANNETGALQPVAAVADAARALAVPFHTDAAQAVGKMPVRVPELGVDLLTIAGHKLYGPKGVGALIVREGTRLESLLHGAPHERGRRPGTENTPGVAGLGAACALAAAEMERRVEHGRALTGRLLAGLRSRLRDVRVNGPEDPGLRLPNTVNLAIMGAPSHLLLPLVPEIATAAGAACHSGSVEPSAVLTAMGIPADQALCALRLSVGRENTEAEMDRAVEQLTGAARHLQGA